MCIPETGCPSNPRLPIPTTETNLDLANFVRVARDRYVTSRLHFSHGDGIELLSKVLRKLGCRARPILSRRMYVGKRVTISIFLPFPSEFVSYLGCLKIHRQTVPPAVSSIKSDSIFPRQRSNAKSLRIKGTPANLFIYTIRNESLLLTISLRIYDGIERCSAIALNKWNIECDRHYACRMYWKRVTISIDFGIDNVGSAAISSISSFRESCAMYIQFNWLLAIVLYVTLGSVRSLLNLSILRNTPKRMC